MRRVDPLHVTLDELWDGPPGEGRFDTRSVAHLPRAAQRYLTHAIAAGAPLARAVRLRMHGDIKLRGWMPFEAEQVIRWDRGTIWKARTRIGGLSVSGSDRLVDGEGAQLWKAFGVVPVMRAKGPDITRSVAGRVEAESMWLPSVLLDVPWREDDEAHAHTTLRVAGDESELRLAVDATGRLQSVSVARWGSIDGGVFERLPFGCQVEEERTFGAYTIPSRVRVGWHFGSDRFETEGEFFRGTIDEAEHR